MTTHDLADQIVGIIDALPESKQAEALKINGTVLAYILHSGQASPNKNSFPLLFEAIRELRSQGYTA